MRLILSLCLIAGPPGIASAHSLPGDANLANQLLHLFLSPHHLPLMLLLLVAVAILCRKGITTRRG
jgi:hypothetical protein